MSQTKPPTWNLSRSIRYAFFTDPGLKRKDNQDAYAVHEVEQGSSRQDVLLLLADGVGGNLPHGDAASRTAVAVFANEYYAQPSNIAVNTRVLLAIQATNDAVKQEAARLGSAVIGTTLTGLILTPEGHGLVFNVGDSRVYLLRQGVLTQLSVDQVIPSSDDRRSSTISQYIGQEGQIVPEFKRVTFQKDDLFFLCSDGVWSQIEEDTLEELLAVRPLKNIAAKVSVAIQERGAPDNFTGVVVHLPASQRIGYIAPLLLLLVHVSVLGLSTVFLSQQPNLLQNLLAGGSTESSVALMASPLATQEAGPTDILPSATRPIAPSATRTPRVTPVPTSQNSPSASPPAATASSVSCLGLSILVKPISTENYEMISIPSCMPRSILTLTPVRLTMFSSDPHPVSTAFLGTVELKQAVLWSQRLMMSDILLQGEKITVLSQVEVPYGNWFFVERANGQKGWVFETVISVTKPLIAPASPTP